jgi:hypothetical protein
LGVPSAFKTVGIESAAASSRVLARMSRIVFTVELLSEWFNRGNVGWILLHGELAAGSSGFLKLEQGNDFKVGA